MYICSGLTSAAAAAEVNSNKIDSISSRDYIFYNMYGK
jgi:hypothetical protein